MFKDIYKYRFLLSEIVRKNVKLQYRNSMLGVFWTFLQPLLTTIVLVLVFGNFFGRNLDSLVNYPIYLLCGRLLYEFYTQSTKRAMRSITLSASVIKKVYVPKFIYPLANTISTFVTFMISMLVLVGFFAYYMLFTESELRITKYALLAIVPMLILFILCLGVGLLLATFEVFFKDVEYFYDVFCTLLFYLTPIFYDIKAMNLDGKKYIAMALMSNPLYSIVSMFRSCVLFGEMWNWNWFYYSLGFSIAILAIGIIVFRKKQNRFILFI